MEGVKLGTAEIVLKGGKPWGFSLKGGIQEGTSLKVAKIEPEGKAFCQGALKVGDHVLKINDVQCLSFNEAVQLIDSAFNTLTLFIWRSSTATTEPSKKETSGSTLWQKASALRQSLRSNKKNRPDEPRHVRSYSDYGDGRLTDATGPPMWEQHPPRHPSRTRRKLTRDSGYETSSGQIEPDYVNSDWLSDHWTDSSESYKPSLDKRHSRKREENRYISRSQSYGRDAYKTRINTAKSALPDLPYHPFSRYSSTESLSSCWSNCTTLEDEHTVYPTRSVPDLDQVGDMVTRKFKKGSVYEALASKSGLDFAPVIQGRPYWERREHLEGEEYARKLIHNKKAETLRNNTSAHHEPEKLPKKTQPFTSPKYQQCDEQQIPPPPPVRDSSSLKYVRQQPHEKYPSWPAAPVTEAAPLTGTTTSSSKSLNGNTSSSHRSNSWTEHTDYPKERVDYCRPKKGYKISPHHLQPVLEKSVLEGGGSRRAKCEQPMSLENTLKMALETGTETIDLDSLCRSTYYPRHSSGSRDYKIHSPPERDVPRPPPRERQAKQENGQQCYWNNSPDSCTPLMDRLRLESEAMPQSTWSPQLDLETPSEAGNESVDSSNSSQETLKWHGSCSDLSCSNRSSVFDSGRSTLPDRLSPQSCDSNSHVVHSSRVEPAQRHDSESVLYYASLARSNRNDEKRNFSTSFPGFARSNSESVYSSNTDSVGKIKIAERSSDISRCKQETDIETKQKYQYLDPEKKHRISDPELKAIQKQAVLSFYHRQTAANLANSTDTLSPHESPPISPGKAKWNQWDAGRLDKVPEHSILATDATPRSSVRSKVIEGNRSFESQLSWSVPNLTELSPLHHQVSSHHSQRESGPGSLPYIDESITVQNVQESKQSPPDSSNSNSNCQHHRLQNQNLPRKVHLKEVHNCNDKSVVQVITTDGVTIAEALKTNDVTNKKLSEYPVIPPKRINKPVPQPPQQVSTRRPPPPIPSDENEEHEEDDIELKTIEESSKQLSCLPNPTLYHETPSRETSLDSAAISNCSSPDLPLPPPPSTNEIDVRYSDEPLPPPPELEVLSSLKITAGFKNKPNVKSNCNSCQSEKNSSPNYRNSQLTQDIALCNSQYTGPKNENISDSTKRVSPKQNEVACKVYPAEALTDSSTRIILCANIDSTTLKNVSPLYNCSEENSVLEVSHSCNQQSPVTSSNASFPRCRTDKGSSDDHCSSHNVDKPSKETHLEKQQSVSVDLNQNSEPIVSQDHHQSKAINSINDTHINVCVTNSATQTMDTPRLSKKILKSKEELECEKLSRDFVDTCGDTLLKNLLVPAPNQKTMMDYMKGLLDLDMEENSQIIYRNHHYKQLPQSRPNNCCQLKTSINGWREGAGLPPHSAYFTISEPKAKLLTRYCQAIKRHDWANEAELNNKKDELIASITRKLEILKTEQIALREEVMQNEILGQEVTVKVEHLAKPNETEKYKLHVEELEKIVNLLLSLSGRLARAQNALMNLTKEASKEERMLLEAKRDKLSEQHEEARLLKDSIDRRSQQVSTFLHRYLTDEEYADYDHFVKMKSKLLMDAREIDEKIKLGEEQLSALRNNMDSHLWTHIQSKSDSPAGQVQLCRT